MLGADGTYRAVKISAGETPRRSQTEFIALAAPRTAAKAGEKYPRVELAPRPFPKSGLLQIETSSRPASRAM